MRFLPVAGAVLLPLAAVVRAVALDPNDDASIKKAAAQYASGLLSQYTNGKPGTAKTEIGTFPDPYYWWTGGGCWGGMLEYTQITQDQQYVKTIQEALVANYGPKNDIMLEWRKQEEGNDDQAFWALALMSALESKFPEPANAPASYLEVAVNAFDSMVARWDTATCGGGLRWQIYPENAYGWDYKNAISNGAFFALGARLARYTGNQTYVKWSVEAYEWTQKIGLISDQFEVFDGTNPKDNCAAITDKNEWSYNNAMFMHGCAFMYDVTKESIWKDRVDGFLDRAVAKFFKRGDGIMSDICEPSGKCNPDQKSFKAYLARWMATTATLIPSTKDKVTEYLTKSAVAAAKVCPEGDGATCGLKWFEGTNDGSHGVGEQLSALEVTQALLKLKQNELPSTGGDAKPKRKTEASSSTLVERSTSSLDAQVETASSSGPSITEVPAAPTSSQTTSCSSSAALSPGSEPVAESTNTPAPPAPPMAPLSSAAAEVPASSDVSKTAAVGGEQPLTPAASCVSSTTVTVTVPPTSAPVVTATTPAAPPSVPTTFIPAPPANTSAATPPQNTSSPVFFPGAASGVQLAGRTLVGAAGLAALAALL